MATPARDAELAQRLRELGELYESLRALTSTLDLAVLVRTVLQRIHRLSAAEALSLLLYDGDRNELVFAASEMLGEDEIAGSPPTAPRTPRLTADTLAVALDTGAGPVGVVELRDRLGDRPFDADDRARLEALAATLAATLDVATLAHDADALRAIFNRIAAVVPSHTAVLALRDAQGRELTFRSSRVLRAGVVDGLRLRLDQGIAGWVARERQPVRLVDAHRDPRHEATIAQRSGLVPRTMLAVPLLYRDALLGVVQVINKLDGTPFTEEEQRLTQALADHAALAIANAQLYRRVELASLTDDLTGLSNTRHFHRVLPAALARGGPVSLLVLDLDALKAVVDRHGHLVGSRTIATVGRLIGAQCRPGDTAARFGGDEFVVVMPGTDTPAAVSVAEAIRVAVETVRTPDGMDVDISTVTASIGVATYPAHGSDEASLFRAADTAMYRVKNARKNGVGAAG